jgi:hypothetical protein
MKKAERSTAAVFFEIKRRVNDAVVKRRAKVRREYVKNIVEENELHNRMLVDPSEKELENLQQFLYYMLVSRAAPRIMVRYRRQAYIDRLGMPLRITMDRDLTCLPAATYTPDVWCDGSGWYPLIHVPVILEIKFTEKMPPWTHRLVRDFGLSKRSTKKYVTCMKALNGDVRPTQLTPARAFL